MNTFLVLDPVLDAEENKRDSYLLQTHTDKKMQRHDGDGAVVARDQVRSVPV